MSDSSANLLHKIAGAQNLKSVVTTMKNIAASSVGQYEKSVQALNEYHHSITLGLGACFRAHPSPRQYQETTQELQQKRSVVIVFGSDQGLVGQFNDVVSSLAAQNIATFKTKPELFAVGERVAIRLGVS